MNTGQKSNFQQPSANLSLYERGVYSVGVKGFNILSQRVKILSGNHEQFKSPLKNDLYAHFFFSLEEYFNVSRA
jgi:hypothetical protein